MEEKKFVFGVNGKKPGKYPPEIKEQAVALFASSSPDFTTKSQCARHVARLLGIGSGETVMNTGSASLRSTQDSDKGRPLPRQKRYAA
jgi:hypothetical protein